ncbi:MAG: family 43 glycosylhydrolase [Bacteroidales bacterium]|nr:family 43 glycosylhydrolase [Bacteroidales bacterium]
MKYLSAIATIGTLSLIFTACNETKQDNTYATPTPGNPYLPLWEHIPDGEPYVFEDPDKPGNYRVYIYGSHDSMIDGYCGREQVVWSASVDSLWNWRYDGIILSVDKNGAGKPQEKADVLYAPDITLVTDSAGNKTYYLYPNNQQWGRNGMVAKNNRPDGPFEVCNWSKANPDTTDGVLKFDPAVFVDDDGRVYGYWGFGKSYAAELDPTTMATVKPGTEIVEKMIGGHQDGDGNVFRFFEASSIRKIKDKYVFIYSRFTADGEFGLPTSNYTLAYAYSEKPLGPWTYGGTIIDGRGREKDEAGNVIASATIAGNTHGSICEINGQWYVFYHRQTGLNEFARQSMVAPITVKVEDGEGGKVEISEGEYTSEGFAVNGLNPLERHSAGIACWYTGPKVAVHEWPNNVFYGSYVAAGYGTDSNFAEPYDIKNNTNQVVNNTDGSIVGYKYFNFTATNGRNNVKLLLNLIPQGIDGTITIMADRPWTSQGGKVLGTIRLNAQMPQTPTELTAELPTIGELTGKHALYFIFSSDTKEKSICTLEDFVFE